MWLLVPRVRRLLSKLRSHSHVLGSRRCLVCNGLSGLPNGGLCVPTKGRSLHTGVSLRREGRRALLLLRRRGTLTGRFRGLEPLQPLLLLSLSCRTVQLLSRRSAAGLNPGSLHIGTPRLLSWWHLTRWRHHSLRRNWTVWRLSMRRHPQVRKLLIRRHLSLWKHLSRHRLS